MGCSNSKTRKGKANVAPRTDERIDPPTTTNDRFHEEHVEDPAPSENSQEVADRRLAEQLQREENDRQTPLPIESVSERKTREAQQTKELPVIYVDKSTKNFTVPKGGARVVVRGEEGEKIQMQRQAPPQQQVRYVDANGNPVQVVGQGQNVVYVQQPGVMYDPYPYYGGRYGYGRRYGYGYGYGYPYGYGYGYGGFGSGLLLGAMLW